MADEPADGAPRKSGRARNRLAAEAIANATDGQDAVVALFPIPKGSRRPDEIAPADLIDPGNFLECAREFTKTISVHGAPALAFLQDEWWHWSNGRWQTSSRSAVLAAIYQWLASKYHIEMLNKDISEESKKRTKEAIASPFRPNKRAAEELEFALRSELMLNDETESPTWCQMG